MQMRRGSPQSVVRARTTLRQECKIQEGVDCGAVAGRLLLCRSEGYLIELPRCSRPRSAPLD